MNRDWSEVALNIKVHMSMLMNEVHVDRQRLNLSRIFGINSE